MIDQLLKDRGFKLTKKTPSEYSSACPFCGGVDRFCVWPEKDRYWCRQCKKSGDSIQLLRDLNGMSFKDAKWFLNFGDNGGKPQSKPAQKKSPKKGKEPFVHPDYGRPPDHIWKYPDERGKELFCVIRYDDNGKGDKDIKQCQPDGLTWSVKGIRKVLYNLHAILKADKIWFCEGEKCCDAMISLGFTATTSPMGAGKWPKLDEEHKIGKQLHGKSIYILPDNDEPGRKHAEDIAQSLHGNAEVFILDLPGLPDKGDICDYIEKYGPEKTAIDIEELASKAKPWHPPSNFFNAEDLLATEYVHHTAIIGAGIMPCGSHIIIAGEAGVGKSLFLVAWKWGFTWLWAGTGWALRCHLPEGLPSFNMRTPRPWNRQDFGECARD